MFKKLLLILGLFAATPVAAQQVTCATRPAGDSSNACASTAFVNNTITPLFPLSVPNGGTGATTFTPNLPLIGNGTGAIAQGTRSGNTTVFGTTTGSLVNGHCVSIDSSGNFVDAGGACTTGGGGGTVSSGLAGQIGYYAANGTVISGAPADAANPLNYGAVANSSGAAAGNVTAFQNAMAANPVFHCPDGQIFYIGSVTVPTTTTRIYGSCTLIATGSYAANVGVLEADSNTSGLIIDGPIIQQNIVTYANNAAIRLSGSSNFTIQHTNIYGGFGIVVGAGANFVIDSNNISNFAARGIYVAGASNGGRIAKNVVNGNHNVGASHCISLGQGTNYTVVGNVVGGCTQFGISVASVPSTQGILTFFTVGDNIINSTKIECINIENAAIGTVSGNSCYLDGTSVDFGISLYGAPGTSPQETTNDIVVSGNTIYNPCKSGIALADVAFRNTITGNYIYTPNQCNGGTADYQSAILLYGGNNINNSVLNNMVIDSSAHMVWQIGEGTFNDGTGNPSSNYLEGMAGTVGLSGQISAQSGSQVVNTFNAWVAYSPVITCGSGAPGSTATSGQYKVTGKTVAIQLSAALNVVGSCGTSVVISLPFVAKTNSVLTGREINITGNAITMQIPSGFSLGTIWRYDNAVMITAGDTYTISGTYQIQ